ncbi:hypothetical protein [Streptomyces sp. NPDC008092]|uniref:hypothetical protein n=1 Tax=Streptomyces sp. NPDC008092 TaxID=3364808 RepID=UPI0036F17ADF
MVAGPGTGAVMPGVFNLDRERAVASFRRPGAPDTETACFGHGDPVTADASQVLRESADSYGPPQ